MPAAGGCPRNGGCLPLADACVDADARCGCGCPRFDADARGCADARVVAEVRICGGISVFSLCAYAGYGHPGQTSAVRVGRKGDLLPISCGSKDDYDRAAAETSFP